MTLQFRVQLPVMLFAAALAVATGFLFGLFPALHSTRPDLITSIRAGAGQIAGGAVAGRFRTSLAVAQIALSTTLLVSAGLFLKSLVNVSRVDLGIRIDSVATFSVSPLRIGYDTLRAKVLYARIEEELRAFPGVTGVTSSMVPLLSGDSWGNDVRVQGFDASPTPTATRATMQRGPATSPCSVRRCSPGASSRRRISTGRQRSRW